MEKYTVRIPVQSYQTNQYGKASVCSLLQFMLEAAWDHARLMDLGFDQLQSRNMFWVLSRLYLEVEKYPEWQDTIVLHTWSAGTDGMYAYREFLLEDEGGGVLLRGNTAWLILDVDSKKIVLLKDYRETFPRFGGHGVCREPKRLRPGKHTDELQYLPVRFSELDVNKHFNSVKALERVLDHFGIDFLNEYEPASIEISYLKEGLAGDRLAVSVRKLRDGHYQSTLVRESDQADLSTMVIGWQDRSVFRSVMVGANAEPGER